MNAIQRSAALSRALKSQTEDLPPDFAERVAALADADRPVWHLSWSDLGLFCGFAAMMGISVAGWVVFGEHTSVSAQSLSSAVSAISPHPWLIVGTACVAIVQLLTFRRRAMI